MAHRLAPEAEADLDHIAISVAARGGDFDSARRIILEIVERFHLLVRYPQLGRARPDDLGKGRRTYPVRGYIVVYRVDDGDVLILRVIDGRRDLDALLD